MSHIVVEAVGTFATFQDGGRPGHGEIGVTAGGAMDRAALAAANRTVGNGPSHLAIESLLAGITLRTNESQLFAVTGAPAEVTVNGRPVPFGEPFSCPAGGVLVVAASSAGLWTYLAVRGGFVVPALFGSGSSSPSAGLGPSPLKSGDGLVVGHDAPGEPLLGHPPADSWGGTIEARVVLGPRDDWFSPAAVETFLRTVWTISPDLNRVGVRLNGPALQRYRDEELPSEGMVRGSVQVSANGQPIVFMADHPVTGGYPVIAVVCDADVDRVAQCRPGQGVKFTIAPLSGAN